MCIRNLLNYSLHMTNLTWYYSSIATIYLSSNCLSWSSCQPGGGDSNQALKNLTIPLCSNFAKALTSLITFSLDPSLQNKKKIKNFRFIIQLHWIFISFLQFLWVTVRINYYGCSMLFSTIVQLNCSCQFYL